MKVIGDIVNKRYKRTQVSKSQQRLIKRYEAITGKKLTLLWEFTNRLGERYIFGRFGLKSDNDSGVLTIAYYNETLHRFLVA